MCRKRRKLPRKKRKPLVFPVLSNMSGYDTDIDTCFSQLSDLFQVLPFGQPLSTSPSSTDESIDISPVTQKKHFIYGGMERILYWLNCVIVNTLQQKEKWAPLLRMF
ncbi:hypothetical protein TNIN_33021 [Trichonephila inaurata madagascariensis]|uniref:Uncharacterized protein n=1 Tax=Trichonephila inaurata madagascariensis TaxID=2747483 RepID=A0A8X6Y4Y3_9ARAC|nr:hypothetical protein TNIN_33021 [Trichonephila inaurata madagascariensis]